MPEEIICSAYETSFFQPRDGKLPLIFNVQIRGEIVPSYLRHTHTQSYIYLLFAFLIAVKSARFNEGQIL